jgi:hypothetical protein
MIGWSRGHLPEQLSEHRHQSVWVPTNRKERHRKGKVQLLDAQLETDGEEPGNKRRRIGDPSDNRTILTIGDSPVFMEATRRRNTLVHRRRSVMKGDPTSACRQGIR